MATQNACAVPGPHVTAAQLCSLACLPAVNTVRIALPDAVNQTPRTAEELHVSICRVAMHLAACRVIAHLHSLACPLGRHSQQGLQRLLGLRRGVASHLHEVVGMSADKIVYTMGACVSRHQG